MSGTLALALAGATLLMLGMALLAIFPLNLPISLAGGLMLGYAIGGRR